MVVLVDRGSIVERLTDEEAKEAVSIVCLWNHSNPLDVQFGNSRIKLCPGDRVSIDDHLEKGVAVHAVHFGLRSIGLPYSALDLFERGISQDFYKGFFGRYYDADGEVVLNVNLPVKLLLTAFLGCELKVSESLISGEESLLHSRYLELGQHGCYGFRVTFVVGKKNNFEKYFFQAGDPEWHPLIYQG